MTDLRTCANCGQSIEHRGRKAKFCSPVCNWKWQNRENAAKRKAERRSHREPCAHCGGPIGIERRAGVRYCSVRCKKLAMGARWRERAPGYMRQYLYGITPEQYDALLVAQDGRCAICRTDTPGGKGGWHVDHNHQTKAIRGLLCNDCNNGLGRFSDDPARLRAAAEYLMR